MEPATRSLDFRNRPPVNKALGSSVPPQSKGYYYSLVVVKSNIDALCKSTPTHIDN